MIGLRCLRVLIQTGEIVLLKLYNMNEVILIHDELSLSDLKKSKKTHFTFKGTDDLLYTVRGRRFKEVRFFLSVASKEEIKNMIEFLKLIEIGLEE